MMDNRKGVVPVVAGLLLALSSFSLDARELSPEARRAQLMSGVRSWAYQLQRLDVSQLASSPYDLIVIDHAPDRVESVEITFSHGDLQKLKVKPDGSRRLVLAYLSIGEAERYRFYWDESWLDSGKRPEWLGAVNPSWPGNYTVEYWAPAWQKMIVGPGDSYVDRIIDEGFDGLYLDRADVYELFKSRPDAEAEMARFIAKITDHARALKPDALVVLQNAEELLRDASVRSRLDGEAKESLYTNPDTASAASADDTRASVLDLKRLRRSGHKVLVVEYTRDPALAADARKRAEAQGFLIHFAERSLSQLSVTMPDRQGAASVEPVAVVH